MNEASYLHSLEITKQPKDFILCNKENIELTIEVNDSTNTKVQWFKDGIRLEESPGINGSNKFNLQIFQADETYNGYYYCLVWDELDTVVSRNALIKINNNLSPPQFSIQNRNFDFYTVPYERYAVVNIPLIEATDECGNKLEIKTINGYVNGSKLLPGSYNYKFTAKNNKDIENDLIITINVLDKEIPMFNTFPSDSLIVLEKEYCEQTIQFKTPSISDNSLNYNSPALPGDILITAYRSDNPDTVCFVTLRNISKGMKLYFTDNGWDSINGFSTNEGITIWEADKELNSGEEVWIAGNSSNKGIVSGGKLDLSTSGDQIFIATQSFLFEGNSEFLISGIQMNSTLGSSDEKWDLELKDNYSSAKPSALLPGTNSIRISPERDNALYIGKRKGNSKEIREELNKISNWLVSNDPINKITLGNFQTDEIKLERISEFINGSFPVGIHNIEYKITDNELNTVSKFQNIIVKDSIPPEFESLKDTIVFLPADNSEIKISFAFPKAFDNCGSVLVRQISGIKQGDILVVGNYFAEYEAEDISGNVTKLKQNIRVLDNSPPVFTEIKNVFEIITNEEEGKIINYTIPSVYDNSGFAKVELVNGKGSGSSFGEGEFYEIFKATDNSGNSSICSLKISIVRNNPPIIQKIQEQSIFEDRHLILELYYNDPDIYDTHSLLIQTSQNLKISYPEEIKPGCKIIFTPERDYYGEVEIKIFLEDSKKLVNSKIETTFKLSILNINDKPEVVLRNRLRLKEGGKAGLTNSIIEIDDSDNSTEEIFLKIQQTPKNGYLQINQDTLLINKGFTYRELLENRINYIHNNSETLTDTLEIIVSDYESDQLLKIPIEIEAVNDKPKFRNNLKIKLKEDCECCLLKKDLLEIIDDDSPQEKIRFDITNSSNIKPICDRDNIKLCGNHNWYGYEKLQLIVYDENYSDTTSVEISVEPVNDKPIFKNLPKKLFFDVSSSIDLNLYPFIEDVETPDSLLNLEIWQNTNNYIATIKKMKTLSIKSIGNESKTGFIYIKLTDVDGLSVKDSIYVISNNLTTIEEEIVTAESKFLNLYPNPAKDFIIIDYVIADEKYVEIMIYNIIGQEVCIINNGQLKKGSYSDKIELTKFANGFYLIRLITGDKSITNKFVILK